MSPFDNRTRVTAFCPPDRQGRSDLTGIATVAADPLHLPATLLRRDPHLPAFWPERVVRPLPPRARWSGDRASELALPVGQPNAFARGNGLRLLRYASGPWRPPRFGPRAAPVALVSAEAEDPITAALARALPASADRSAPHPGLLARARDAMAALAENRLGGPSGLPDPGPKALGCAAPRSAVLVVDPCRPSLRAAAVAMLDAARRSAAGRPVVVARDPTAPLWARPVLPGPLAAGGAALDPWTLLDAAEELHCLGGEIGLLALAAGVPLRCHGAAPYAGHSAERVFAALIAATRCADPFRRRPWSIEEALAQLIEWKRAEVENRPVAVCLGVQQWKHARFRQLFASAHGVPAFRRRPESALALARRRGGAVAAWGSAVPDDLPARCSAAGVPLILVEDGFIRSAGLGAAFLPGASFALDRQGLYYDPGRPTDLEALLATAEVPPALLARAATLRATLVARGVTKYNLTGAAPEIPAPPGRRLVLVPGQVEDDASVRLGGGTIRTNLALLRAVRAAEPDAFVIYKPHPDIEAGYRRGRIPASVLAELADQVVPNAPMARLLERVDAVHTLTSLTGFEALLRGVSVTTWGRPFYAGWGLTDDRDPPPRRGRKLSVDQLVAVSLILYPRYVDPLTGLPCPVEVLVERLAHPEAWPTGRFALLRRWQGRAVRAWARWRGLR